MKSTAQLMHTGKVGGEVSAEDATACAQQCALNGLAAVKSVIGDLSRSCAWSSWSSSWRARRTSPVSPVWPTVRASSWAGVRRRGAARAVGRRRPCPAARRARRGRDDRRGHLTGPDRDATRRLPPSWSSTRVPSGGDRTPVTPKGASTVVLLRDTTTGPEVYLLRRHLGMAFAPGCSRSRRDRRPARLDAEVAWAGPSPRTGPRCSGATSGRRGPSCAPRCARRSRSPACCWPARRPTRSWPTRPETTGRRTGRRWSIGAWGSPTSSTDAASCCAPTCSVPGRTGSLRSSSHGAMTPASSSPSAGGQRTRDVAARRQGRLDATDEAGDGVDRGTMRDAAADVRDACGAGGIRGRSPTRSRPRPDATSRP